MESFPLTFTVSLRSATSGTVRVGRADHVGTLIPFRSLKAGHDRNSARLLQGRARRIVLMSGLYCGLDNNARSSDTALKGESTVYPGGKNGGGAYQTIINLMPPHSVYIEPFLGSGAVMRMKRPAKVNIGLDLDGEALAIARAAIVAEHAGTRWQFERRDGVAFLAALSVGGSEPPVNGSELVYCDPPYVMSTRRSGKLYKHEFTDGDHQRLLFVLKQLPCMVMISGYESNMYGAWLRDWNAIQYQAMTRGGSQANEWVWFNFPAPVALHDYRYLGKNFRERERIKRKKARWTARLERMPVLERQSLLAAIEAFSARTGDGGSEIGGSGDAAESSKMAGPAGIDE